MATAVERTTAASGDQADRSRGSSRGRGSRRRLEGKDPRLNGGEGAPGDGSPGGDAESPELALAIPPTALTLIVRFIFSLFV
jgi:hypothetical protein